MSKPKSSWVDMTDLLTEKGVEAVRAGQADLLPYKVGEVLMFDYEGSRTNIKITRFVKSTGRMWGKEIQMYDSDDVEIVDK